MMMGSIWSEVLDVIHTNETSNVDLKDRCEMVLAKYDSMYLVEKEGRKEIPQELGKIHALSRAYCESPYIEVKGQTQAEFHWDFPDFPRVHGYGDLLVQLSTDPACWIYEFKYSTNPDNYSKFTMSDQLSTYFLGMPDAVKAIVRVFQVPAMRQGANEEMGAFVERVYSDIKGRPRHYVKDNSYWRSEFAEDMEMVKTKARLINEDIHRTLHLFSEGGLGVGAWMQNKQACFSPFPCHYLPICENGNVSEDIYAKREVKV